MFLLCDASNPATGGMVLKYSTMGRSLSEALVQMLISIVRLSPLLGLLNAGRRLVPLRSRIEQREVRRPRAKRRLDPFMYCIFANVLLTLNKVTLYLGDIMFKNIMTRFLIWRDRVLLSRDKVMFYPDSAKP